jgi:hypothetical protein
LMWLEYHPLVKSYARGDIDPQFATTYRLPIPQHAPFAIGYTFEDKPHHYLGSAYPALKSVREAKQDVPLMYSFGSTGGLRRKVLKSGPYAL